MNKLILLGFVLVTLLAVSTEGKGVSEQRKNELDDKLTGFASELREKNKNPPKNPSKVTAPPNKPGNKPDKKPNKKPNSQSEKLPNNNKGTDKPDHLKEKGPSKKSTPQASDEVDATENPEV
ncbi:uncharacterized protein LOC132202309 [Neocloeon triangulifer]|uniref:uncharacterized protein LOC132202309 n=1 Tax=Neocloeon triangulifer TaxID=2078957 RepID=UPI00286F1867|nr:uncharacterized protein LOC132202309 [Neocloeon triangulifer]